MSLYGNVRDKKCNDTNVVCNGDRGLDLPVTFCIPSSRVMYTIVSGSNRYRSLTSSALMYSTGLLLSLKIRQSTGMFTFKKQHTLTPSYTFGGHLYVLSVALVTDPIKFVVSIYLTLALVGSSYDR